MLTTSVVGILHDDMMIRLLLSVRVARGQATSHQRNVRVRALSVPMEEFIHEGSV